MRERLRKIAERRTRGRVDLLGEETEVVGEGEDAFQQRVRASGIACSREILDEPEAADAERSLAAGQPVGSRFVAVEQPIRAEALADLLSVRCIRGCDGSR